MRYFVAERSKFKIKVNKYIQDAIDNASLIANTEMFEHANGTFFVSKDQMNYSYAYFGKEKKQIRGTLIVLKDGSVYNGTTLVTDEYKEEIHLITHIQQKQKLPQIL